MDQGCEVVVLGSGNAYNLDGRGSSSLLFRFKSKRLLFDAGPTILERASRYAPDLDSIDILLLSHFHGDHIAGLPALLLWFDTLVHREKPLEIIAPDGAEERVVRLYELFYGRTTPPDYVTFTTALPGMVVELWPGASLVAYPISHQPESLGYRIELARRGGDDEPFRIALAGDSSLDERLRTLVRGVDLAIVEMSLESSDLVPQGKQLSHIDFDSFAANFPLWQARETLFLHLTDRVARRLAGSPYGRALEDGEVITLQI